MRFGGYVANRFFEQPILNSPNLEPAPHHNLGLTGNPSPKPGCKD
jgi:hypothetical protein